ncbi:transmembrane protein, putative [Medicago truncatula]|uniref:Transmembrane protein, putative n=1 Tax=Medicago truncatula TaxID=3880 RepID=A0A072UU94_MEDTR|nr:transmembrane protein, putative [Medicago truncatula]
MRCLAKCLSPVVLQERILDGLSLGAKERDLELIRYKNMKIRRQKYVSWNILGIFSRTPFAPFAWTPSYSILAHNLPRNILGIYLLRF